MPFWSFNINAEAAFLLSYPRARFTVVNIDFLSKSTCSILNEEIIKVLRNI